MDIKVVDELLANINIVDVIQHYIPLKKAGGNFKALCPFHDEKTPSFNVSEKKQIFKCFGCGISGNAVSFVRNYEKLSFWEAVRKVAELTGYALPEEKYKSKKSSLIEQLYKVYELSKRYFRENLDKYGENAKRYLAERGITEETQKEFEFGYALNSFNGLQSFLLKNFIKRELLVETGLFGSNERGVYDLYRDRIMIPIHTVTGRTVAFGGRKLDPDQPGGKYINSPTTKIYNKSNELFGLNITKYNIGKGDDYVLVSEGYLDMLRLYEYEFKNSVASLGTALTSQQISLLGRYTKNIYIIYDGDLPGIKAAVRASSEVVKKGLNTRIVELPANEDPDSYLVKEGKEALQHRIDGAHDLSSYLKRDERLGMTKKDKLKYLMSIAGEMDNAIDRDLYLNKIADDFEIALSSLLSELKLKRKSKGERIEFKTEKYMEEKLLLKLIFEDPDLLKDLKEEVLAEDFLDRNYSQIYSVLVAHAGEYKQVSTLEMAVEPEVWARMSEIMLMPQPEVKLEELINDLKLRRLEKELSEIQKQMTSQELTKDALQKYKKLKKKIRDYNGRKTGRLIYN